MKQQTSQSLYVYKDEPTYSLDLKFCENT